MINEPNRLDLIESLLLQTATNLNQVTQRLDQAAQQQTTNTQAIGNLTVKLDRVEEQQEITTNNLNDLSNRVNAFISTADTVLGRSAVLDDVVVGLDATVQRLDSTLARLDRNFELHQQRFEENQRSTNAAVERLEAILVKLMDK